LKRLRSRVTTQIQFRREVLAENLRRIRQALGYSLRDLGKAAGISHSHILKIETGKYDFQVETLGRLAIAMNVPPGLLLDSAVVPASTSYEQAIMAEKYLPKLEFEGSINLGWTKREHRIVLQFASECCVLLAKLSLSTNACLMLSETELPPVPGFRAAWETLAEALNGKPRESVWRPITERASVLDQLQRTPVQTLIFNRVFNARFVAAYVDQVSCRTTKTWIVEGLSLQKLV
jgi:transcriptional regulator with XRE-family HTH domain